jgi:hypothetical protein
MRFAPSNALALAAALLAAVPAAAQNTVVRGQVVDVRAGQPVAGAAVYVGNDRTVVIADAQGRFVAKHVRPGTRAMWASAPGYSMDVSMVDIAQGETTVRLEMRGDPVRLATLTVSTSRLDRRTRAYAGTARVFRESDMSAGWYRSVLDLVETRGGVRPTSCSPSYAGFAALRGTLDPLPGGAMGGSDCVYSRGSVQNSRIFIDESLWIGGLRALDDFGIAEVARVEVFGNGREVHVYTRQFMDWASRRAYVPTPIGII